MIFVNMYPKIILIFNHSVSKFSCAIRMVYKLNQFSYIRKIFLPGFSMHLILTYYKFFNIDHFSNGSIDLTT